MSPTDVETMARRKYNSVGDSFFSQAEILDYIYAACLEMARECLCIETTATTATVNGTQSYAYPTRCLSLKRITYNGNKLKPINFREDDTLTNINQATTATGTPQYYYIWDDTIYLRPTPNAAQTLKYWYYQEPDTVTAVSTLEVPTQFHTMLVDYVVSEMAAKDSNFNTATYHRNIWQRHLIDVKRWTQKRKRADDFATVQNEATMAETFLGVL